MAGRLILPGGKGSERKAFEKTDEYKMLQQEADAYKEKRNQAPMPESWGQWGWRNVRDSALGLPHFLASVGAGGPASGTPMGILGGAELLQTPDQRLAEQLEAKKDISRFAQSIQPEEPRNTTERIIQGTLSQLPFIAASGGLGALLGGAEQQLAKGAFGAGAKALARSPLARVVSGETADAVTTELGFGPVAGLLANVAGSAAHGKLTGGPGLQARAAQAYEPVNPKADFGHVKEPGVFKQLLNDIEWKHDTVGKQAAGELQKLDTNIRLLDTGKGIDLRKAFEIRKNLGDRHDLFESLGLEDIAKDAREALNKVIKGDVAKKINPQFVRSVSEGDRFHQLANVKTEYMNKLKSWIDKSPKIPYGKKVIQAAASIIGEPIEKFATRLKDPKYANEARKLFFALDDNNTPDIAKYVTALGKYAADKD